jgi:hypothetical protein
MSRPRDAAGGGTVGRAASRASSSTATVGGMNREFDPFRKNFKEIKNILQRRPIVPMKGQPHAFAFLPL